MKQRTLVNSRIKSVHTQQVHTEELDGEIVTFIRASEEYVHLKNKDDEYEYTHSMIPPPAPQQDDENAADDSINKNLDRDEDRSPHNKRTM